MKKTNATTQKQKYQITKEVTIVVKNIVLEGVKTLKAEKVTTTFEVKRELHPKTNKPFKVVAKNRVDEVIEQLSFDLVVVTTEELAVYRKSGIPSFTLKVDGKCYYTRINDNISFLNARLFGAHRCAVPGHECRRLSAASDEKGGCEKVRESACGIERYPWITTGYETFNTKMDSFVVANCQHYEECKPKKLKTVEEIEHAKLALAQYVWDDVKSAEDVKKRLKGKIR